MKIAILSLAVFLCGCASTPKDYHSHVSDMPTEKCVQGVTYDAGPVDSFSDFINEFRGVEKK